MARPQLVNFDVLVNWIRVVVLVAVNPYMRGWLHAPDVVENAEVFGP
ncbi:hypothetical protein [Corallococcus exiguus]|uniref:Uncharacterized protein n=1 Tax=Corallococcus exiguus TaxID=83462 RepID=A0A7X4YDF5_9BACT|nr:hypothetical protein [Corallococcus exiguus]NBC43413.1 hypothetical protein [Corallococcus exiguus]